MLPTRFREGFKGALDDALGANVDPGSSGHLAVHEQPFPIQLVEVAPVGPMGHQIGVGDQHPGRIRMGLEHADRLPGLHQQRFVLFQFAETLKDRIKAGPIPRRPADATIHHETLGILGHLRIKIVLEHPICGLREPALAALLGASRRTDDAAFVPARILEFLRVIHGIS